MLAAASSNVADAILALFRRDGEMSAGEIHAALQDGYGRCSLRAVYKELTNLMAAGIVVKQKGRFSLSLPWMLSLFRCADDLFRAALRRPAASLLPAEKETRRWRFHDLRRLDQFWLQLIFLLFEGSATRTMFVWAPHFWFHLLEYGRELQAQDAMSVAGNLMYMIVGGDTFLDRQPERYWSRSVYRWSYEPSSFHSERQTYYDVIDDYVLTVKLDARTAHRLGECFRSVKTARDAARVPELALFDHRANVTLSLAHDESRARALRSRFCRHFGLAEFARGS